MKGNVTRGKGFRGILEYALTKGQKIDIAGNMEGKNARELAKEFGICRELRPEVERPVWHCSLSLPEGEHLTDQQWQQAAEKLMTKIGMHPDNHQYTVIKHSDTDYEHVHIVASRIGLDSKLWHGQWEARKVHMATQEIEKEMNLTLTKGPDLKTEYQQDQLKEPGIKVKVSQKEREMWLNKGVLIPPKMEVAAAIENALEKGKGTVEDLKERLEKRNIEVRVNQSKTTDRIHGVSFYLERGGENCKYKASQVHKKYSWKTLSERLETRRLELSRTLTHEQNEPTNRISRERGSEARPDRREDIKAPEHGRDHASGTIENGRAISPSHGISSGRLERDSSGDQGRTLEGAKASNRPSQDHSHQGGRPEKESNLEMGGEFAGSVSEIRENIKQDGRPNREHIDKGLDAEQPNHLHNPSVERIIHLSSGLQSQDDRTRNQGDGSGNQERVLSNRNKPNERDAAHPVPTPQGVSEKGGKTGLQKIRDRLRERDEKVQKMAKREKQRQQVEQNLKRASIMEKEIEEFKVQINLVDYAYLKGYAVDTDKSSRRCTVMRNGSEKIGISVNHEGKWLCYDFRREKGGSIIDLAQDFERSKSLGRVRLELRPMLTSPVIEGSMGKKVRIQEIYRKPRPSTLDGQKVAQEYAKMKLTSTDSKYLKSRDINPETAHDARFYGRVLQDRYRNICFPHRDGKGVTGAEKKNSNFNGFSEGGYKSIWYSNSKPGDERLVICESGIDALSYFELYDDGKTQYCSIGGQINQNQLNIIDKIVEKNPDREVVLAFDNDENGRKYVHKVQERNQSPNITVEMPEKHKDWNKQLEVQRTQEREQERKLSYSKGYSMSM